MCDKGKPPMDDTLSWWRKEHYTTKLKPRKVLVCYHCKTRTLRLYRVDRTFISGDGHFYSCNKCGYEYCVSL